METPSPPLPKGKRRVSRGRRSSIQITSAGISPTIVNAPLNNSILGSTAQEQIASIKARIVALNDYKEKLLEEKEHWTALEQKYSKAACRKDVKLKQPSESRLAKAIDDCGIRPSCRFASLFNDFRDVTGANAYRLEKETSDLRERLEEKKFELITTEEETKQLQNIYKEAQEDCVADLEKKKHIWTGLADFVSRAREENANFQNTMEQMENMMSSE